MNEYAKNRFELSLDISDDERQHIVRAMFSSLSPLKLKAFSPKQKKKVVTLSVIAQLFEFGRSYTEAQVNAVLMSVFDDYATIRRALVDFGFLRRTRDGSVYERET